MSTENRGMLIVISGPAGSGKGTVVKELRAMTPNLGLSVSFASFAAPIRVCSASFCATARGRPHLTPPSASASMNI